MSWKQVAINVVEARAFQALIIIAIVLNTLLLAFETDKQLARDHGALFHSGNLVFSVIFTIEIGIKIFAQRTLFFRSGWNLFDFTIVAVTISPLADELTAMRALRVIRLLRLTSALPSLRRTVENIFRAIPGVFSILIIFILIYFVASIMGTLMFQSVSPEYFGDLAKTSFSLFQIMTLEAWASDIVRPITSELPMASLFFILFIIITNFVLVNFFVAVFIEATNSEDKEKEARLERIESEINQIHVQQNYSFDFQLSEFLKQCVAQAEAEVRLASSEGDEDKEVFYGLMVAEYKLKLSQINRRD